MEDKPKITQRTRGFFGEVKSEMKKVTWPTRGEVQGSTAVVVAVIVAVSVILAITDGLLGKAVTFLIKL